MFFLSLLSLIPTHTVLDGKKGCLVFNEPRGLLLLVPQWDGLTGASGCFTDLPYSWILGNCLDEALNSDVYCTEIDYSLTGTCAPWIFVQFDNSFGWQASEDYCQATYSQSLWCPSTSDESDIADIFAALMTIAKQQYGTSVIAMGAWQPDPDVEGDFECLDSAYTFDVTLNYPGFNDIGDEDYLEYIIATGLNDVDAERYTRYQSVLCAQNWTHTVDPEKFGSHVSGSDVGLIQECVLNEIDPFIQVNDLQVLSQFEIMLNEYDNAYENDDTSGSFCIESLTAMVNVEAIFDNEFGCQVEYSYDLGSEMPLYQIDYQIHFSETGIEDGNINDWQMRFSDRKSAYSNSIDDILSKSDTVDQIGFNIVHDIIGINSDILSEEMMIKYNTDTNFITMDSFAYNSDSIRPFYFVTNDWNNEACEGNAQTWLNKLTFENMLSNSEIEIEHIERNNTNVYGALLSNFLPYYQIFGNQVSILMDYQNINYFIDDNNKSLSININNSNNNNNNIFSSGADCWAFEFELPSSVAFEKNYISTLDITLDIELIGSTIFDGVFSWIVTITDNQFYVGILIECDKNLTCATYFTPNETQTDFGRQNPRYLRKPFVDWSIWSENKNNKEQYGKRLANNNRKLELTISVTNDPIMDETMQFAVTMSDIINASYDLSQNMIHFGAFSGKRDMSLQFGHYIDNSSNLTLDYHVNSVIVEKSRKIGAIASSTINTNISFVGDENEWQLYQMIECPEFDDDSCKISVYSDNIMIENVLNSEVVFKCRYPTKHGYFSSTTNKQSTISTTIDFCCSIESNFIWMIVSGTKYFIFGIGATVGYSFFPINLDGKLATFDNKNVDIPDIDNVSSILTKLEDFDLINGATSDTIMFEMINDVSNNLFTFNLHENNNNSTRNLMSVTINNDSFTPLQPIELYFVSYSDKESYSIESMRYLKELDPNIQFDVSIDSQDNLFEQIAAAQDSRPLLVPSLFDHRISLIRTNKTNTSEFDNNIINSFWHLEISATFDTDCYGSDSMENFIPGYALLTLYSYNETTGYREELHQVSILQTECPSNIDVVIEYNTTYDPSVHLDNCTVYYIPIFNFSSSGNNDSSSIYYQNSSYYHVYQECFSNELIVETPFIVIWSDLSYDYLFKPNWYYSNQNYTSEIKYGIVYDVIDPDDKILWLLESKNIGTFILILIFPFCSCICSFVVLCCNAKICCTREIKCCDIYSYVLDGSKIRQKALRDVKMYHFTNNSQFLNKRERDTIDGHLTHIHTPLQKACKHVFLVFATIITIIYAIAFYLKYLEYNNSQSQIFYSIYFVTFAQVEDEWDDFFFPTFVLAFISLTMASMIWIFCCLCTCYGLEYHKLRKESAETAKKMIHDIKIQVVQATKQIKIRGIESMHVLTRVASDKDSTNVRQLPQLPQLPHLPHGSTILSKNRSTNVDELQLREFINDDDRNTKHVHQPQTKNDLDDNLSIEINDSDNDHLDICFEQEGYSGNENDNNNDGDINNDRNTTTETRDGNTSVANDDARNNVTTKKNDVYINATSGQKPSAPITDDNDSNDVTTQQQYDVYINATPASKPSAPFMELQEGRVNFQRKFNYNEGFIGWKHFPFIASDCFCGLLNTFVFTLSFWIGFYLWFAHYDILLINDLPNSLNALQKDTKIKINIIESWQEYEQQSMKDYYDSKTIECNNAMSNNNDAANLLMDTIQTYHNDQMTPTIDDLTWMESELRSVLDNVMSGAKLSAYAGSVDEMVQEIDSLVNDAQSLLSTVGDVVENALTALCVGLGATALVCSPYCGAVIASACLVAAEISKDVINSALDSVQETISNIGDTAETPEISASSGHRSGAVDTNNVNTDDGTSFQEPDNSENSEYTQESSNTQQTNLGEDFENVDGFDISTYSVFFQFSNIWVLVTFVDLLIIYRKIIFVITRAVDFYQGKIKIEDSRLFIEYNDHTHWQQRILKLRSFFGCLDVIRSCFKDIVPIVFISIAFGLLYVETSNFFDIDVITSLGIHNIFTAPVIAAQYRTNSILSNKQDSYNSQLLPQLSSNMQLNIETIETALSDFNQAQFTNVTNYNKNKCRIQLAIASYIDTLKCFEKYYDYTDQTATCTGCESDLKSFCQSGGEYVLKEFANDDNEVSESAMSERRKYCQFDKDDFDIDWNINDRDDANSTTIHVGDSDNTLQIKCPNGFIIQTIHFIGSGDNRVNKNVWNGVSDAYPFIYRDDINLPFSWASRRCENIDSTLISIHNSATEDMLDDILPSGSYWIGLNDIANENKYKWKDGSQFDYHNWARGEPENDEYCCDQRLIYCWGYCYHGKNSDGVVWVKDQGWKDLRALSWMKFVCNNPDIRFKGIDDASSIKETIDSLTCIEANRGPLTQCQEFLFENIDFGDDSNGAYQSFNCEGASTLSGYNNAAWFMNGIVFKHNSGTIDSISGIICCLIPGTIYNGDNENVPQSPQHIDAFGSIDVTSSGNYDNNFYGIKNIVRGGKQSIQGFTFDSISDNRPQGCAMDGSNGKADYCMNNRVGIVDYESIVETEDGITPNIDTSVFECGDGCDPLYTSECEAEYNQDNPQPNPFVAKFECKNINFTYAIMNEYKKCSTYPVFAALFYDYHSELHQLAIVQQLNPHTKAIGNAVLKFLQTIFIIIIIKLFLFPLYFKLEEEIASSCCDAIRLKRIVQVEVAKELTAKQIKKMTDENVMAALVITPNQDRQHVVTANVPPLQLSTNDHKEQLTDC